MIHIAQNRKWILKAQMAQHSQLGEDRFYELQKGLEVTFVDLGIESRDGLLLDKFTISAPDENLSVYNPLESLESIEACILKPSLLAYFDVDEYLDTCISKQKRALESMFPQPKEGHPKYDYLKDSIAEFEARKTIYQQHIAIKRIDIKVDYTGFLSIYSFLQINEEFPYSSLDQLGFDIHNMLDSKFTFFSSFIEWLAKSKYITKSKFHFGVPPSLSSYTEIELYTSLYGMHVFFESETGTVPGLLSNWLSDKSSIDSLDHPSYKEKYAQIQFDNDTLAILSPACTFWVCKAAIDKELISALICADDVVVANQTFIRRNQRIYSILLESFLGTGPKKHLQIESSELRQFIISNRYMYQMLSGLSSHMSNNEAMYEATYHRVWPKENQNETLLSEEAAIHDVLKEIESDKRSKFELTLGIILFGLAGFSLVSFINDVSSFLEFGLNQMSIALGSI